MKKIRLNIGKWCGGGRGATPPEPPQPQPAAASEEEAHIKRLDELDSLYQVDWSRTGFLGRGHFAEVYRGVDIRKQTSVAVKRIVRRGQDVKTLRQEIASLLKVNGHRNIVKLYDVFIDANLVVLVMELLEGGELFSRVVNMGAYSEQQASVHFRRIVQAVDFMHKHGIIHRDLKPENLVLATRDPDSEIKISDFGLSKILDNESMTQTVVGTSAYAAPEVGLQEYNANVDSWSLGVILFVVLAAYHPFDPYGKLDDMGLRNAVTSYQWNFNDKVWDDKSDNVKDLISRLLCPPEHRLSPADILQHPWIREYQQLPSSNILYPEERTLERFVSSSFPMHDDMVDVDMMPDPHAAGAPAMPGPNGALAMQ